jgi:methionine aminopeptidase
MDGDVARKYVRTVHFLNIINHNRQVSKCTDGLISSRCTSVNNIICHHLPSTRFGLFLVNPGGLKPVVVGDDTKLDAGGRKDAYSSVRSVRSAINIIGRVVEEE